MGVVYLARHEALGRQVALKVMPAAPGADQRARKRWRKEAKAFSLVRHPNVVVLYDVGEVSSWYYLVLEYIPGRMLKSRLAGPMPPRDSALLMVTIAEAVHFIHEAGLLHLDLKPANILIDGDPDCPLDKAKPKVADFGIARFLIDGEHNESIGMTADGPWGGTPSYMAPEQISGKRDQLCPATDIHALGAILYELLTGRPPFQGASPVETLDQVRSQEPVAPRRLNPKIPRDLETITLKCLHKNPARRYASAKALAGDLTRWLDGRPVLARPTAIWELALRWCQRRPAVASLTAALAATVLVSFLVLFEYYRRADNQRARAEAARAESEQNLEVASIVIDRLERLMLNTIDGPYSLPGDQFDDAANVLRQQVARVRTTKGFNHKLLGPLFSINNSIASRLHSTGRSSEALAITKELISLIHACRDSGAGKELHLQQMFAALMTAGRISTDAERSGDALVYVERATSLLDASESTYERQRFAAVLSDAYLQIEKQFAENGRPTEARRARDGQLKLLSFVENVGADQPDLLQFKACVLADRGEWKRARELVRTLALTNRSRSNAELKASFRVVDLMEWYAREMRHFASNHEGKRFDPGALDRQIDDMLDFAAKVYAEQDMNWPAYRGAITGMTGELATRAASQRKTGQLDEADRTVASLVILANRLLRRYPEHPSSHLVLNDAYLQRSKNAWKRNDLPAVRQALVQSVEALQRALVLDPVDVEIHRLLQDRKQRLARVPNS